MDQRELNPLFNKIDNGVKLAIKQALDKHEKLDQAISFEEHGKIITLKGKQISEYGKGLELKE